MTPYQEAVKRYTDAGGTWPPKMARMTPWRDTGRYEALACRGCGRQCDPARRWCPACSEALP